MLFAKKYKIVLMILSLFSLLQACNKDDATVKQFTNTNVFTVSNLTRVLSVIGDNEQSTHPSTGSKHGNDPSSHKKSEITVVINKYGYGSGYIAKSEGLVYAVINGIRHRSYDEIEGNSLVISNDGKRSGYFAKRENRWHAVIDGIETAVSLESGSIAFSEDSRHVAFETKSEEKWNMNVDNTQSTDAVMYYDKAVFLDDSSKIMFIENTRDEGKGLFNLTISDLTLKTHNIKSVTSPSWIAIGNDLNTVAAIIKDRAGQRVIMFSVHENKTLYNGDSFDEIVSKPVLSVDSQKISYIAKKFDEFYLVVNSKAERIPKADYPVSPAITNDGTLAAVAVVGIKQVLVKKYGEELRPDAKGYDGVTTLLYSPDGKNLAFIAEKNKRFFIVSNGKAGEPFSRIVDLKFTPDGNNLIYSAREGNKRFVVYADKNGKTIKKFSPFDRIFETNFTKDSKSIGYGAVNGKKIVWQVDKL